MNYRDKELIHEAYKKMYDSRHLLIEKGPGEYKSTNTEGFYTIVHMPNDGDPYAENGKRSIYIYDESDYLIKSFELGDKSVARFDEQKRVIFIDRLDRISFQYDNTSDESILQIVYGDGWDGPGYTLVYTGKWDDEGFFHATHYEVNKPSSLVTTVSLDGNVISHENQNYRTEYEDGILVKEIKYKNSPQQIIYTYDPETGGTTSVENADFLKTYYNGLLTSELNKKTGELKNYYVTQSSNSIKAAQKAQKYMDTFHGMFFHAFEISDLNNLLKLKHQEVCVSTVRSNTVFRDPSMLPTIVLIGFGNITELYDFDAYSWKIKSGKRKSDHDPGGEGLFDIDKSRVSDFVESKYYDEGFMPWESADVLLACVSSGLRDKQITRGTVPILRKAYPGIKFIRPENFSKIKSSKQLLRLLYKLRDDRDSAELMKEPLHKYEESINILNVFR